MKKLTYLFIAGLLPFSSCKTMDRSELAEVTRDGAAIEGQFKITYQGKEFDFWNE